MPTSSSCEGQCWVLPPLEFFMTSVILTGGIRNASGHRRLKLLFPTPCIIRSTKKSAKNPIYMVAVFWISPKKNMVLWACKVLAGVLGWKSAFSAKSRYKWCRWHQDMPRNSESTPKNQYPPPGWMMDYDGWGLPVAWYLQLWGVQISEFCWGGFCFLVRDPKNNQGWYQTWSKQKTYPQKNPHQFGATVATCRKDSIWKSESQQGLEGSKKKRLKRSTKVMKAIKKGPSFGDVSWRFENGGKVEPEDGKIKENVQYFSGKVF